ncbi:hypothetical protein EXIGLDRAFT_224623 [Exidia glandulosa HHB12029]|uniref:Uncharacterized protein n=1 Tax=Exidia glandulosa HHB12029 TaxID=1314781 RepID=A0A165EAP6_EXIGL|nr:hypothetical protein EXIGLDRAFT_224623 [Exidia glandulosa HHB12029]
MRNNGLNGILKVALKPASSHQEIIERFMQKESFQGQAKKLKLILMCMLRMRFPDTHPSWTPILCFGSYARLTFLRVTA